MSSFEEYIKTIFMIPDGENTKQLCESIINLLPPKSLIKLMDIHPGLANEISPQYFERNYSKSECNVSRLLQYIDIQKPEHIVLLDKILLYIRQFIDRCTKLGRDKPLDIVMNNLFYDKFNKMPYDKQGGFKGRLAQIIPYKNKQINYKIFQIKNNKYNNINYAYIINILCDFYENFNGRIKEDSKKDDIYNCTTMIYISILHNSPNDGLIYENEHKIIYRLLLLGLKPDILKYYINENTEFQKNNLICEKINNYLF